MGIIRAPTLTPCPAMESLPDEALSEVAAYFQALSEPTRLKILNLLRDGERNVGDIATATGTTAANVSRHLTLLTQHGLVAREARGNAAFYRIADESIYALCDLVCGNIGRRYARVAGGQAAFVRAVTPANPG